MGSREGEPNYHFNVGKMKAHEMLVIQQKEANQEILKEGSNQKPYFTTKAEVLQYMRSMEEGRKVETERQNQFY